ncbi:hypothetical protein GCM10009557_47260 [Virgisporangium ochraceum]|uniref:Uncharacterized protein n=1 Tax=Virgisporangium ochraceum TaxID=65505 RepID=A0A8J4A6L8_9ACTN|nr:hypothetical protein [Virgisporangium ochraceum]GIJ75158.1 hypothetical protein Voc01_100750 [Virgisporangium ochraceum]
MKVERQWWNGSFSPRERRDVFIRSDGQRWEVMAQIGGIHGRSRVHPCPGRTTAEILATAWRGGGTEWREVVPAKHAGSATRRFADPCVR